MAKNKTYFIQCSELVTYEITIDAINENVASSKAMNKLAINPSMHSLGSDGFQIDKIMELS